MSRISGNCLDRRIGPAAGGGIPLEYPLPDTPRVLPDVESSTLVKTNGFVRRSAPIARCPKAIIIQGDRLDHRFDWRTTLAENLLARCVSCFDPAKRLAPSAKHRSDTMNRGVSGSAAHAAKESVHGRAGAAPVAALPTGLPRVARRSMVCTDAPRSSLADPPLGAVQRPAAAGLRCAGLFARRTAAAARAPHRRRHRARFGLHAGGRGLCPAARGDRLPRESHAHAGLGREPRHAACAGGGSCAGPGRHRRSRARCRAGVARRGVPGARLDLPARRGRHRARVGPARASRGYRPRRQRDARAGAGAAGGERDRPAGHRGAAHHRPGGRRGAALRRR